MVTGVAGLSALMTLPAEAQIRFADQATITQLVRSRKIVPLERLIMAIEQKTGSRVLDAGLVMPGQNRNTWYYIVKLRSRQGQIGTMKLRARDGAPL